MNNDNFYDNLYKETSNQNYYSIQRTPGLSPGSFSKGVFITELTERKKCDEKVLEDLQNKVENYEVNYQPFVTTDTSLFQESFLYRLFHCYENYICYYKNEDFDDPLYLPKSDKRLDDSETEKIEIEILNGFINNYTTHLPNDCIFPESPVIFIYNFLKYLIFSQKDIQKLKSIENHKKYNNFFNCLLKFYKQSVEIHKIIKKEELDIFNNPNETFSISKLKTEIVCQFSIKIGF